MTKILKNREGHNIVLVGSWNERLFSPSWVSHNLAEGQKEIGFGVAITDNIFPRRLDFLGIYLQVSSERLMISPKELNEKSLQQVQEVTLKIVKTLPHTPLKATGVNFRYTISEPNDSLLKVFRTGDQAVLASLKAEVVSTLVKREVQFEGLTLNATFELSPAGVVQGDFNFHGDTTSADAVEAHLSPGMLKYQAVVEKFLAPYTE